MHTKTNNLFLVILLIFITGTVNADDFTIENVPVDFIGTYIPVQYDNMLHVSRSHYNAMLSSQNQYHDILLLHENICYSNLNFHDGYAIRRTEFDQYTFVTNQSGRFLIDEKGNSYRKISDNIGSSGYADFGQYVLNIIFSDIQMHNSIQIENDSVIIDGVQYSIILDSVFFQTEDVSLWLRGNDALYALIMDGVSAKLYESYRDGIISKVSDQYITDFPLFFWNDETYPKISIFNESYESLRYLRNLIFAKHGYVFRSEELSNFFSGFSWYDENPTFTQENFSLDEKRLLERIIEQENE
jgi:hypothetical protein